MKKLAVSVLCAAILSGCLHPTGSVSEDAVLEMLDSPKLAVTPYQPAWLNEGGEEIWPLSEGTASRSAVY